MALDPVSLKTLAIELAAAMPPEPSAPSYANDFTTSLTCADWKNLGAAGHEIRAGDAIRLERLSQSAYACATLSRLLLMSDNADGCEGEHPLNGNIVGGLHHALSVVASTMQTDLYELAERTRTGTAGEIRHG